MNDHVLQTIYLMEPFWLTTWFRVVILLLIAAGIFVFYKINMNAATEERAILKSKLHERDELLFYARENEKKANEEALNAHKATGELLARLSHEIRTPMNGVLGMTGMLAGTQLTDEQSQYLESISSCSNLLISSINEILLNFAVGDSPGLREMELRDKLNNAEKNTSHDKQNIQNLTDEFSKHYPLRILVGEDNQMNQQLVLMILKRLGYEADIAVNGKDVLEVVSEKPYDLIFMDVQMPEMDGLEATRMIRLCLSVQPVIVAMTANAMLGDREECLRAGMDDYISKPLNFEELVRVLEKWAVHIKEKA
jgi:CheY-like chemotaxis protein